MAVAIELTKPKRKHHNIHLGHTLSNWLQWCHNGCDGVSNHLRLDCLLNRSKKTSKLHVTGLCEGNSPVTGEYPSQRASNAENVSIWWRRHVMYDSQHNIGSAATAALKVPAALMLLSSSEPQQSRVPPSSAPVLPKSVLPKSAPKLVQWVW